MILLGRNMDQSETTHTISQKIVPIGGNVDKSELSLSFYAYQGKGHKFGRPIGQGKLCHNMHNSRDYQDEQQSEAWRKIVERMGSPVPDWNGAKMRDCQTKEQLLKYANNCRRFLSESQAKADNPDLNADGYWTMSALWWEMRMAAIESKAKRAPEVPLPRLGKRPPPERPQQERSGEPGEPSYKRLLRASLDQTPSSVTRNSPIRPMTIPGRSSDPLSESGCTRTLEVDAQDVKEHWFQNRTSFLHPPSSPPPSKMPSSSGLKEEPSSPPETSSIQTKDIEDAFLFNQSGH